MGACDFSTVAEGPTAEAAFKVAVEDAQYEHGHGGYSGTIAEKRSFKLLTVPAGVDPKDFVRKVAEDETHGYGDKWGPALVSSSRTRSSSSGSLRRKPGAPRPPGFCLLKKKKHGGRKNL